MQQAHAANTAARTNPSPPSPVPRARSGSGTRDLFDLLEEQVARVADVVLKAWALADRYEASMERMTPSVPTFADQQSRVATLRAAAERGRNRLVYLAR